jgi:hypothetical protein
LYGLTIVGFGICALVVLGAVREASDLALPFVEGFGYIAIGAGLWFVLTGRTFAEGASGLPRWFLPGFAVFVAAAGVVGFFLRQ